MRSDSTAQPRPCRRVLTRTVATLALSLFLTGGLSAPLLAQSPRLTRVTVTPAEVQGGGNITVQVQFDRIGAAFPIMTSSNPRAVPISGSWSTGGSSMVTRRIATRPVSQRSCVTVTAHWSGRTRSDEVCVLPPPPPPPSTFDLRLPSNGSTRTSRTVDFSWSSAGTGVTYALCVLRQGSSVSQVCTSTNTSADVVITTGTSRRHTVTQGLGGSLEWLVRATRAGGTRWSNQRNRLTIAEPTGQLLSWTSPINTGNLPGLAQWPADIRQRVESHNNGQGASIADIVNSRLIVRGDGRFCRTCHTPSGAPRYKPDLSNDITPTEQLLWYNDSGGNVTRTWSQSNGFADLFRQRSDSSLPVTGRKPQYLRDLFLKWISDGRRTN